jgi:ribosome-associated protein
LADNIKLTDVLNWLNEKQAEHIAVYDVANNCSYTDFIVVCNGSADLHNKAIANHILLMAKKSKYQILGKAGLEYGQWILVDFGDVIVHIFRQEKREYYDIDQLFSELTEPIKEEKDL